MSGYKQRLTQNGRLKTKLANTLGKRGVLDANNLSMIYAEMSDSNKIPQVSNAKHAKPHTGHRSVRLTSDSGGGKNSISHKHKTNATNIFVATYNIRTMSTPESLVKLEKELEYIKWDVLGLCETRLPGEKTTTLKSGHMLYQSNSIGPKGQGGVAFLVNRKLKYLVTEVNSISDRVIYMILRLNRRYSIQFIHGYAPTSQADDEEMEIFLEDISKALISRKTHYKVVSGDFNAKIGQKSTTDSDNIGKFGLGIRNQRGDMLINYLNKENLYCLNTFFKKPQQRKWTWESPDGKTKNEIDFILANSRKICTDVSVLNRFDTNSDHRLVRASLSFNLKTERNKLIRMDKFPTVEELKQRKTEYQNELKKKLEPTVTLREMDINELNRKITTGIHTATKKICMRSKNKKTSKLQPETLHLMEQRKRTSRDSAHYRELNKRIHKEVRKDIRNYNTKMIKNAIEDNANMRVLRSKLSPGKHKITKMKDQQGNIISDNRKISEHIKDFYTHLYISSRPDPSITNTTVCNVGSEDVPEIAKQEIQAALKQMKNRKCPGEDRITCEMLKMGGAIIENSIQILLNKCLQEGKIPDAWQNAEVILLFKKGDNSNIENYRPISLLSHLYKLLTRIITNRLTNKFDAYQPVEQAGFRKGFSTIDHLQAIRTLIEKTTEYNIPLHLAFVDFHKAFDSIETWAFTQAMDDTRIDSRYTNLLKYIYKNATFHVKMDEDFKTDKIKVNRGVRQGDPISPKLFTLALENVFKKLQWEMKGINIDGSYLNHLRFADDIVLINSNVHELSDMLKQLNDAAREIGLKMNITKTKIISNTEEPIYIDGTQLENVEEYIYLGHAIKIGKENQTAEIKRRIRLAWVGFGKMNYIFRNCSIPINLKRKVFDTCILPIATYGLETMAMTRKTANQLRVMQRAMERAMLGISLRDRQRNEDIRQRTRVVDVIERFAELKWQWVGHVARQDQAKWTAKLTHWRPRQTKRNAGRPQKRWLDDIKRQAGNRWFQRAQDRTAWRNMKEAYIQEWITSG